MINLMIQPRIIQLCNFLVLVRAAAQSTKSKQVCEINFAKKKNSCITLISDQALALSKSDKEMFYKRHNNPSH